MPHDPSRSVPLAGASNFRDLGGYRGHGGRHVKWRRLFRSAHLATLTAQDQARLEQLGVARAVDFRGVQERAALPYQIPGLAQHVLGIEPTVVQRVAARLQTGESLTPEYTVALMQDTYRSLSAENAPRFAELFALLLASDAPLVFHCTAGKDRTGFAAALILLALGVPRDVVVQDYLLTNTLFRRPASAHDNHASPAVMDALWRVQEDYLEAAFTAVDGHPGGFDGYLAEVLGVRAAEREQLRAMYLE
jgi:protein-tyrosine phosphatase